VEEVPGVNTQGATLAEARANLKEALALVLETNRELAREQESDAGCIREPVSVDA
jgi:predicted RNase H-like HicB family nuclease